MTLITYGVLLKNVMNAADLLSDKGVQAQVLRLMTLSSLPIEEIAAVLPQNGRVVIAEEVSGHCGVAQELAYGLQKLRPDCTFANIDLGDRYVPHGSMDALYDHCGLSAEAIKNFVMEVCSREN